MSIVVPAAARTASSMLAGQRLRIRGWCVSGSDRKSLQNHWHLGAYASYKEGGPVAGTVHVATDFIPGFVWLKLTLRWAVGEEHYQRTLNATYAERSEAFSAGWDRLQSFRSGVDEFTLLDGHRIKSNDSVLKTDKMQVPSKIVWISPTGETGEAIVRLADGQVFKITGFRDLER